MKFCSVCDRCFQDIDEVCLDATHGKLADGPYSLDAVPGYRLERILVFTPRIVSYQARQIEYGQNCVISIAKRDSKNFLSDAKIAASLFHSGVAGVVESGELETGSLFAAFEGSRGLSLRDILKDGSLSLLDQIRIARQASEAVHAIHLAGLAHGALRPENVSVEDLGSEELSVKVHNIDLGAAFAEAMLSNRFAMDSSLERLRYFAPERFRGEAPSVQADVYSLGLMLYEILSGHPPFEAASATALADMHLHQKPPEIKIDNFDLRMLLTHTITESLQKQPSFRQSTADLFARQMRHIEQLATHVSTPPPAVATAVAAAPSPVRIPVVYEPHVQPAFVKQVAPPETGPVPIRTPDTLEPVLPKEQAVATRADSVTVQHPIPYVRPQPQRSRLKGMKKRVHSHISDAKAQLSSSPSLIEWNQPEHETPPIDTLREELTLPVATSLFDADEEITHVRTVERIGVDWSEPVQIEKPELAAEFFPTLPLTQPGPATHDASIFGGYQSQGRGVGRLPVYAAGAFAMVLIGFGFFRLASALSGNSDGYIGEYRPTPVQIPTSVTRAEPVAQPAAVSIPAQSIDFPAAASEPEVDEVTVAKQEDPSPVRAVSKTSTREPQKSARTVVSDPAPIIVGQRSTKATPIVPSTLVITRESAKARSTIVAGSAAQKPKVVVVGSGSTRPRIVSLPD